MRHRWPVVQLHYRRQLSGDRWSDVSGEFTAALEHNLIGISEGSTGFTNGVSGNLVGTKPARLIPKLGPLALNSGLTLTHELQAAALQLMLRVPESLHNSIQAGIARPVGCRRRFDPRIRHRRRRTYFGDISDLSSMIRTKTESAMS